MDTWDDIDIEVDVDSDSAAWDRLIDQIVQGNVIPVIGNDIIYSDPEMQKTLLDFAARKLEAHNASSFSDIVYQTKMDKDCLYGLMNQLFAKKKFAPSTMLKDLLSIKQFPFVITTSYTPVVEDVMREVWGKELKVLRFNNNPSENHDISGGSDMRKPTIYYMFGRVGEMARRYVLTDTDMLDFCSSWLSDSNLRPRNLAGELKSKYLLMLGNSYSDWLFRFIWYSIRKANKGEKSDIGESLYAHDVLDNELSRFLERNHTFLQNNPQEVISQIQKRLSEKLVENEKTKFNNVENNVDVFISYSRADSKLAQGLYEELTKMGKRVWFDKNDISHGGNFMSEIRNGIRTARYFLPIFTHNIELEKDESHVYRNEWEEAIQVAVSLGRRYIIPLAEEGFNFYKATIPDRIQQHNALIFDPSGDYHTIAEKIIHIINEDN